MSINLLQSNDEVNEARANIFSALGDPTRLGIFQALVEADQPLNVSELCDRTELGTNLVSHHLQCLKNCQLVDAERDGRKKYYEVSWPEAVEMLALPTIAFGRTSRASSGATSSPRLGSMIDNAIVAPVCGSRRGCRLLARSRSTR